MTSVSPVTPLEQETQSPFEALNALIIALQTTTRDDDELTDNLIRIRSLHSEVLALIDVGQVSLLEGSLYGRGVGYGPTEVIRVGDGLSVITVGEQAILQTTAGRAIFVRNTPGAYTVVVPAFITMFQYQLTAGGASGYKDSTATHACSGGAGQTQIGSFVVQAGDVVSVSIGAVVGATLVSGAPNIAGADATISVNGIVVVRAVGGIGGQTSSSISTEFLGGYGGTTPTDMAQWVGGIGRNQSAGLAFGSGMREEGSGCGGNVNSVGGVTAAGSGFVILRY